MQTNLRAQSLTEYSVMLGVLAIAIMVMFPMVKRSTQSLIGLAADQIGDQRCAEQSYTYNDSYIVSANSKYTSQAKTDLYDQYGIVKSVYNDAYTMGTNTLTNTGFTKVEKSTGVNSEFSLFEAP